MLKIDAFGNWNFNSFVWNIISIDDKKGFISLYKNFVPIGNFIEISKVSFFLNFDWAILSWFHLHLEL